MIPTNIMIIAQAMYAMLYPNMREEFADAPDKIQTKCIHNAYAIVGELAAGGYSLTQGEMPTDETKQYHIGPLTMERVFRAANLTNLSDMQAVMDQTEVALQGELEHYGNAPPPGTPVDPTDGMD